MRHDPLAKHGRRKRRPFALPANLVQFPNQDRPAGSLALMRIKITLAKADRLGRDSTNSSSSIYAIAFSSDPLRRSQINRVILRQPEIGQLLGFSGLTSRSCPTAHRSPFRNRPLRRRR